MPDTYETYLREPGTLTLEQMQRFHGEMAVEVGEDPDALALYEELCQAAEDYLAVRAGWRRLSREEKREQDSLRTSRHNGVVTHVNMLARCLRQQGKAAAWREELGDENADPYCRKRIGDFGCYLVFVNSVCAR